MGYDPDTELMLAVRDGNLAGLETLFRRHYAKVYALCVRLTADPDAAEDLVQDAFLRMLRYRRSFRGAARFTTWMYSLTRNLCLDHVRSARRKEAAAGAWARETSQTSHGDDRRLALLEEALARLPLEQREVLVLRRFHGLTSAELGEILSCSAGAVRLRVHRALQALKQAVQELELSDNEVRRRVRSDH
jgi:RNA polymerase sigma-70 factor (ECF subfamily)